MTTQRLCGNCKIFIGNIKNSNDFNRKPICKNCGNKSSYYFKESYKSFIKSLRFKEQLEE